MCSSSWFTCTPLGIRRQLLAFGLIVCSVAPALGVCSEPHPRVNAEFFKSDAVFVGKVLTARAVPARGDEYDGWSYRLRVRQTFRGPVRQTLAVFTENSSGRFPLDVGETYLLFASVYKGRLEIDNCGNSAPLKEAQNSIRQIEQIGKAGPYGEIEGVIRDFAGLNMAVPDILFIARSSSETYSARLGRDGWFHMRVKPGTYKVQAKSSQFTVTAFDLSYDDPRRFVVHRGGCAELAFRAEPK